MKKRFVCACIFNFVVALAMNRMAFAREGLFYKEVNLIGGYSSRDRWVGMSGELLNSIGFEDYRKFSND